MASLTPPPFPLLHHIIHTRTPSQQKNNRQMLQRGTTVAASKTKQLAAAVALVSSSAASSTSAATVRRQALISTMAGFASSSSNRIGKGGGGGGAGCWSMRAPWVPAAAAASVAASSGCSVHPFATAAGATAARGFSSHPSRVKPGLHQQQQAPPQPTPQRAPPLPPLPIPTPMASVEVAMEDLEDEEEQDVHQRLGGAPDQSGRVSVMAFYVGQKLDLVSVVQANFLSQRGYKISDDILVVPLEAHQGGGGGGNKSSNTAGGAAIRSALVVFKHGSVVFFNVPDALQARYLHAMTRHCGEVVPQSHRFRETLECKLRPWQEKYHEMGQDVVHLRELNEDSIKVVADVIGHSVALNFYNKKADRMLEDFRALNNSVEGSGVFSEMDKKDLFKLVALNNKILTDAMSSGLLEQSKPAWNFNRLDALWNDLRDEFSIGDRFSKVEHKINHVQSNTKFFLEILNHQKSNKLEWIIIVLIAAEIVLSCIDLYHQILV